jgi:hypothetical protein
VLYVYAFVAAPATVPEVAGIGGGPIRASSVGALDAIVAERAADGVAPTEEAIVAHARVVEAVAGVNEAVLPVRFGALHADEAALRDAVAGRSDLLQAIERVRGCVEFGVRVIAEAAVAPNATSGTEYMRTRLDERKAAERAAASVHEPLAELARESTAAVAATPALLLTSAYLVERDRVEAFRSAVGGLAADHSALGIVCTGPWPPYSFATAEGRAS